MSPTFHIYLGLPSCAITLDAGAILFSLSVPDPEYFHWICSNCFESDDLKVQRLHVFMNGKVNDYVIYGKPRGIGCAWETSQLVVLFGVCGCSCVWCMHMFMCSIEVSESRALFDHETALLVCLSVPTT